MLDKMIDYEQQRRKMTELVAAYKSKIAKLEEKSEKRVQISPTQDAIADAQIESQIGMISTLRDNFKSALAEADARSFALERENQLLKEKLAEAEATARQVQDSSQNRISAIGSIASDAVPAVNMERHIEGLSEATTVLAEENSSLASSLKSAMAMNEDDEDSTRAKELAMMHQKLMQLHVGFIMHAGNNEKLEELASSLGAMPDREMELAWFWFRGAIAGLGGALRGRTNTAPTQAYQETQDDGSVNIAWGVEDGEGEAEEEQGWTSEEDDEEAGQNVGSLEPYMGHVPHWKHTEWDFPELESFSVVARSGEAYCGPTDESNWVIPGLLLVGAFPGCPDDDENWELITSILCLGITTFVCLQDEYSDDAPEEDWRYERNGAIRPYFRDVREIVQQVEDAPDDFPDIHISSADLNFVHFPIIDCDIGEDVSVYELAVELVMRLARGEVIYLHCWGGHGRTGSLVCIMLHLMYGLSAKAAMERCQFVHDLRRVPMEVASPQKPSQRNQVRRIVGALEAVDKAMQP